MPAHLAAPLFPGKTFPCSRSPFPLAALYERWSLPFGVVLGTSGAVCGAFGMLWLRRAGVSAFYPAYMVQIETEAYSPIGLGMLIGLAAKNAILIVEFAKAQ